MLPQFPQFKNLELSDKEDVEKITHKYPPYSDFNFVSMWSWDIKGDMLISQLNDNLVVKFTDYVTGEPFYSFLGNNKVNETAEELLELSKKEGLKLELKLVPEDSIKDLDNTKFKIQEDRDHFDYEYDIKSLSELEGEFFLKKRKVIKKFAESNSFYYKILDLNSVQSKSYIKEVNKLWEIKKKEIDKSFDYSNEFNAINKFLNTKIYNNTISTFLFVDNLIAGYAIYETISDIYVISHFAKANYSYPGIYDWMIQEDAKLLLNKGYKFLNFEQDLGLPGLKQNKKSFSTGLFLKKYLIMLK
ncbi:phosphatidylglycerol lysyltransferase domain-containing protein [Candidatus Nomurabacteria bacterium]|nr:phosphatidylglycerol lysyltransferase domain-containing protein [Candidatus Nomurabacteria bacterium]